MQSTKFESNQRVLQAVIVNALRWLTHDRKGISEVNVAENYIINSMNNNHNQKENIKPISLQLFLCFSPHLTSKRDLERASGDGESFPFLPDGDGKVCKK